MEERRLIIKQLEVALTPRELEERWRQHGRKLREHAALKEEAKAASQSFSSQLKDSEKEAWMLLNTCESGKELRPVQCEEIKDLFRGTVEVVRLDPIDGTTFDRVVSKRPLEDDERRKLMNPKLPGVGAPLKTAAPATPATGDEPFGAPQAEMPAPTPIVHAAPTPAPVFDGHPRMLSIPLAQWNGLEDSTRERFAAELAHAAIEAGGRAIDWEEWGDEMVAGPIPAHPALESIRNLAIEFGLELAVTSQDPTASSPAPGDAAIIDVSAAPGLLDEWCGILEGLLDQPDLLKALEHGTPVLIDDQRIRIAFEAGSVHAQTVHVAEDDARDHVTKALTESGYYAGLAIEFVYGRLGENPPSITSRAAQEAADERAEQSDEGALAKEDGVWIVIPPGDWYAASKEDKAGFLAAVKGLGLQRDPAYDETMFVSVPVARSNPSFAAILGAVRKHGLKYTRHVGPASYIPAPVAAPVAPAEKKKAAARKSKKSAS